MSLILFLLSKDLMRTPVVEGIATSGPFLANKIFPL